MGQKLFPGLLIRPRRWPFLHREGLLPDDRHSRRELADDVIGSKVFPAHLLDPYRPAARCRQAGEAVHVFIALADPANIPARCRSLRRARTVHRAPVGCARSCRPGIRPSAFAQRLPVRLSRIAALTVAAVRAAGMVRPLSAVGLGHTYAYV